MFALSPYIRPIMLLIGSNGFMTTAWYWHLRYKEVSLFYVIVISWGLAFVEYCLAVPANRYGNAVYKRRTAQDALSQGFGFALIAAGAFFVFHKW